MEQMDHNLLFRWFVGLSMDEAVWVSTVFSKNRDRLLEGEVAQAFMMAVLESARNDDLFSDEHFTVDGTLLEAWVSLKSFQSKDKPANPGTGGDPGNPSVKFHGEKRSNDTHESCTDADARLAKKGRGGEAKPACCRQSADGEPPWAHCGLRTAAVQWNGGAECGAADGRPH